MYAVGSNMPGYMPDEPAEHIASFEDALEALISELERDQEVLEDIDDPEHADEYLQLDKAIQHLSCVDGSKPHDIGFTIGNRHHFLSRV